MNPRLLSLIALCSSAANLTAQQQPSEPPGGVRVVERGPHHAVHYWTTEQVWPDGRTTSEPHFITELASGLHYFKDEQWIPSKEEIEIFQDGAVARQGQHQVIFAANVNSEGSIDLLAPDGKRFRSHVLGLAYLDTVTGRSEMIAEIKDSIGEVIGNQVLYRDAFDGPFRADVRYTYTRGGFEQDIILHESPPSPVDYGMEPAFVRLEVWTEFLQPPIPTVQSRTLRQEGDPQLRQAKAMPDLVDQTLSFGAMDVGSGRAFMLEGEGDSSVRVAKSWVQAEGRQFLIEAVELNEVTPLLQRIRRAAAPAKQRNAQLKAPAGNGLQMARAFPRAPGIKQKKPMQMASAGISGKAVVLDYQTLNSSLTNYTFKADQTYRISGAVNLYGASNVIEGGTVLKFNPSAGATIDVKGTLIGDTDTYRPAVLTASADSTVGESIGGALSGYYATTALNFDYVTSGTLASLHNIRILYAVTGVKFNGGSGHEMRHLQMVNCGDAFRADNAQYAIRNLLGWNLTNALTGSSSTGSVEHATFNGVTNLLASAVGQFTNCLLTVVANTTGLSGEGNTILSSTGGVFKTVGYGYHYLADGSALRDAGVTNINPTLAAELKKRTTYAPLALPNLTSNLTFLIRAERDTGLPDVGWHYAPLDYYASAMVVTNATIIMTNGVALGLDVSASWGIDLRTGKWISVGTPTSPNYIVRAHMAQEKSGGNPGTRACFYDGNSAGATRACALRMRFTEFSQLQNDGYMIYVGTKFTDLEWTHSRIYNPSLVIDTSGSGTFISGLTNSLWERGAAQFGVNSTSGGSVTIHMRNNLTRNMAYWGFFKGSTAWTIRDNLFDTVGVLTNNGVVVQNWTNAYFNTVWGLSSGVGNTNLASLTYEVGPLGKYYLPTNSALINKGTRNATNAMLYQFTTTTNQVKETNSIVDIGLHYVAVNGSSQPIDTDGEGLPDYFEDANGDGFINTGETSWTNADTDGDGVSDYLEVLLGRNPTVAGSTNDVNNKINLRLYTPLK